MAWWEGLAAGAAAGALLPQADPTTADSAMGWWEAIA